MAKSKYRPEILEVIYKTLQETGSDSLAIEAASISTDTFYAWVKKYPEFSEKVAEIKKNRVHQSEDKVFSRKKAAEDYLDKVFRGEVYKVTRKEVLNRADAIVTLIIEEQIMPTTQMLEKAIGQTSESNTQTFNFSIGLAKPADDYVEEDEL